MTNEYIIDYETKGYLTIWWGSDDGGIIYTIFMSIAYKFSSVNDTTIFRSPPYCEVAFIFVVNYIFIWHNFYFLYYK